jgi:hypothetical protein
MPALFTSPLWANKRNSRSDFINSDNIEKADRLPSLFAGDKHLIDWHFCP